MTNPTIRLVSLKWIILPEYYINNGYKSHGVKFRGKEESFEYMHLSISGFELILSFHLADFNIFI